MADSSLYTELKAALSSVSGKALNYSSRLILSNNLNIKSILPSKSGHARDYRGLAELMGFQYCNIKLFERNEDPTLRILEAWETQPNATLDKLVSFLEELDRHDIIKELAPLLERNAEAYLESQKLLENPVQDPEMTFAVCTQLVKDFQICSKENIKEDEEFLKSDVIEYNCKNKFVTVKAILPWSKFSSKVRCTKAYTGMLQNSVDRCVSAYPNVSWHMAQKYPKREDLNEKVSLYYGSITDLKIHAIVNASNNLLIPTGGVDEAIHRAAGPELLKECSLLGACQTGEAKITRGYNLPAKYVIHTVGPFGEDSSVLRNCYYNSLAIAKERGLRTIAFPCISTGVHMYPVEKAAHVALRTVRSFLTQNETSFDRIIFSLVVSVDIAVYEALMQHYFPV